MSFIAKQADHVNDYLWVRIVHFFLDLLDGVELELSQVKRIVTNFATQILS